MDAYSRKADGRRHVRKEHDAGGITTSAGRDPGSRALRDVTLRFGMDDRTYCLTLNPAEAASLWDAIGRHLADNQPAKDPVTGQDCNVAYLRSIGEAVELERCGICGGVFEARYFERVHVPCPEAGRERIR